MPERPRLTPAIADVRRAVRDGLGALSASADVRLDRGDLILVACSGGADSLALAAATKFEAVDSADAPGLSVGAVIVEHGLQAETAQVAQDTATKLRELGLDPVLVIPVSVSQEPASISGGTEAAARDARYQALASAANSSGAKAVLLGHTLNDQAETVLLGLARGSGLRSVAGMQTVTAAEGFVYLRPLLSVTRSQTEACCTDSGLNFWTDPHNADPKFSRVRVRNLLLPAMEAALGPGVAEALARTSDLVREDLDFLESQADAAYDELVREGQLRTGPTGITISCQALARLHQAVSGRVVHQALTILGAGISKNHVDEVLQLVLNWHGQKELTLPRVRVFRQGDDLTLKSTKTLRPGAC